MTSPSTLSPKNSNNLLIRPAVSFGRDVFPLLNSRCLRCHKGYNPSSGIHLDLRAELASNQRITPSGGLAYLTTEEWLARWREHRRRNAAEKGQPEK